MTRFLNLPTSTQQQTGHPLASPENISIQTRKVLETFQVSMTRLLSRFANRPPNDKPDTLWHFQKMSGCHHPAPRPGAEAPG
jgi:hypothetical protein